MPRINTYVNYPFMFSSSYQKKTKGNSAAHSILSQLSKYLLKM